MQPKHPRPIGFYLQAVLWYPLFYTLSILPYSWLYLFSDGLRLLVHKVFKYRVKVVRQNLHNAFPGYSSMRISEIETGFYRSLCDMVVETIKLLTVSQETLTRRVYIRPENNIYNQLYSEGKSVIAVLGHYGNWEMVCQASTLLAPHRMMVIYKPLSNAFFEAFFTRIRTRLGAHVVTMNDTLREIIAHRSELIMPVMLGDQTPSDTHGAYWHPFLNQDTPVMMGIEKIAGKMHYVVVVNDIIKHARGVFEIVPHILTDTPEALPEGEITRLHTEWLEQQVKQRPELWLWSHRRWKHQRPA